MDTLPINAFNRDTIIEYMQILDTPYVPNNNPLKSLKHGIRYEMARYYYADLINEYNWDGKLDTFTREMAKFILIKEYWFKLSASELLAVHRLLADRMMNFAYNCGIDKAVNSLCDICNAFSNDGENWSTIPIKNTIDYELLATLKKMFLIRGNDVINTLISTLFSYEMNYAIKDNIMSPFITDKYTACGLIFMKQTWYASIILAIDF